MAKVFISYSHDSEEHKKRVRDLADQLRSTYHLDVALDQYMLPAGPLEGWPHWSEAQVRDADYVLVASTAAYCGRYELREAPGIGLGAVCEGRLIHQLLYNAGGINSKFRVIHFVEEDKDHVPDTLQAYHRYLLYQAGSKNELIAWLLGKSSAVPPASPGASPAIAWPPRVPGYVWGMADRKDITARFELMLSGQSSQRIVTVSAESNSGKTHLLAELRDYAQKAGIASSLLDCKGCPALNDLFELMFLDLSELPTARMANATTRAYGVIQDLQQLTAPALVIFDTYEKASADSQKWIESQFLSRIDRAPGLVVVIAGQFVPDRSKYAWANSCAPVILKPIREGTDWHEYSQRKGMRITLEEAGLLAAAGQGMPGVIQALLENVARERRSQQIGAGAG
jgi:hypothetical protein